MTTQLQLVVDRPLVFEVRALDGRLLDRFEESELVCVASGQPEKSWHEAACWAHLAIASDRRAREPEAMPPLKERDQSVA